MAPTVPTRSAPRCPRAASVSSTMTSPISTIASRSGPRWSSDRSPNSEGYDLSMIFSENRFALFRIMLSAFVPIRFPDFSRERDIMRSFRGGLLIGLAVAVLVGALAVIYEFYDTRTLKRTVRRGEVLCGVNKGLPGFSIPDDKGNWTGFDVDFCRAVAAAIFNDPSKAKFV